MARTEQEIRQHIADLELLKSQPCDCANNGPIAAAMCAEAQRGTEAILRALRWAAGDETPSQVRMVQETAALCGRLRAVPSN